MATRELRRHIEESLVAAALGDAGGVGQVTGDMRAILALAEAIPLTPNVRLRDTFAGLLLGGVRDDGWRAARCALPVGWLAGGNVTRAAALATDMATATRDGKDAVAAAMMAAGVTAAVARSSPAEIVDAAGRAIGIAVRLARVPQSGEVMRHALSRAVLVGRQAAGAKPSDKLSLLRAAESTSLAGAVPTAIASFLAAPADTAQAISLATSLDAERRGAALMVGAIAGGANGLGLLGADARKLFSANALGTLQVPRVSGSIGALIPDLTGIKFRPSSGQTPVIVNVATASPVKITAVAFALNKMFRGVEFDIRPCPVELQTGKDINEQPTGRGQTSDYAHRRLIAMREKYADAGISHIEVSIESGAIDGRDAAVVVVKVGSDEVRFLLSEYVPFPTLVDDQGEFVNPLHAAKVAEGGFGEWTAGMKIHEFTGGIVSGAAWHESFYPISRTLQIINAFESHQDELTRLFRENLPAELFTPNLSQSGMSNA